MTKHSITYLRWIQFQFIGKMDKKRTNNIVCAVAICNSPKCNSIIYHKFPKDSELAKKWIVACKRKDKINPKTSSVCSEHFLPSDYKRDLQNELLGRPIKQILNKDAVPSVNLAPLQHDQEDGVCKIQEEERKRRFEKRQQKETIDALLTENEVAETILDSDQISGEKKVDVGTQKSYEGISVGIQVSFPKGKMGLYKMESIFEPPKSPIS